MHLGHSSLDADHGAGLCGVQFGMEGKLLQPLCRWGRRVECCAGGDECCDAGLWMGRPGHWVGLARVEHLRRYAVPWRRHLLSHRPDVERREWRRWSWMRVILAASPSPWAEGRPLGQLSVAPQVFPPVNEAKGGPSSSRVLWLCGAGFSVNRNGMCTWSFIWEVVMPSSQHKLHGSMAIRRMSSKILSLLSFSVASQM